MCVRGEERGKGVRMSTAIFKLPLSYLVSAFRAKHYLSDIFQNRYDAGPFSACPDMVCFL